ncbi:rho GTPase activating protein at 54D isoform X2 [Rhodnius prolixus]|uniref:rho GTPase activating protein at 54D isoform X2 n=1 Tax=Rhodnius prolixus TaxID=13249 RepID=UPI003D188D02
MSCDNSLSASESKKLAKKLRHEDPEQFQTLVRMHLSFVLDLHTEETDGPPEKGRGRQLKWGFVPFSKKIRGPAKDTVDGIPLTKEVISQIYILINFLTKEENLTQEGIFRRSGKMTRQQELKLLLTQGRMLNLEEGQYSVHDVASVLKSFLAELPEPVLTEAYYPAYCQIAELCQGEKGSKGRILRSLQLLLLLLPYENRRLLKTLLRLLHLTTSHVATNRMSAQNLATLFTPHLICPRKLSPEVFHSTAQNLSCIVAFMITEGVSVFEVPKELSTDIKAYWDRRRLTPNHFLERSISESTAANTVFSFVDRERTAQENVTNPTETALAQLYAHIQSLPESHKKKRLIKQFNKENGQGTPRTKSIGDSIKKHIFCKNVKVKSLHEIAQLKSGINCNDCVLKTADQKLLTPFKLKIKTDNLRKRGLEERRDSTSSDEELLEINAIKEENELEDVGEELVQKAFDNNGESSSASSPGSHDNSAESEASSSFVWIKSLPLREFNVDHERHVLGKQRRIKAEGEWRRGELDIPIPRLPIQQECVDSKPSRSEFFQQDWRLRPINYRLRYRRPPFPVPHVLPRRRESPFTPEFWLRLPTNPENQETTS